VGLISVGFGASLFFFAAASAAAAALIAAIRSVAVFDACIARISTRPFAAVARLDASRAVCSAVATTDVECFLAIAITLSAFVLAATVASLAFVMIALIFPSRLRTASSVASSLNFPISVSICPILDSTTVACALQSSANRVASAAAVKTTFGKEPGMSVKVPDDLPPAPAPAPVLSMLPMSGPLTDIPIRPPYFKTSANAHKPGAPKSIHVHPMPLLCFILKQRERIGDGSRGV
jgi:hypothetical protein